MKSVQPLRDCSRRTLLAAALGVYIATTLVPTAALAVPSVLPTTLAQVPAFIQNQPEPNVFLTMDDSGSMEAESLPDDLGLEQLMFPHPYSDLYVASNPNNTGMRPSQGFTHTLNNARARSSAVNLIYYDPTRLYLPWAGVNALRQTYANATPAAAYYHPYHPGRGTFDLTNGQPYTGVAGSTVMIHYRHNGGALDQLANYTRVEINPATATYTIAQPNERSDCTTTAGATTCSYLLESTNFANWYQYYRSRTLLARGAVGRAFSTLNTRFRVGLGRINAAAQQVHGAYTPGAVLQLGINEFAGNATFTGHRDRFYDELYNHRVTDRTPSRRALYEVGRYFQWDGGAGGRGPWSDTPDRDNGRRLTCRQSYHVYATDGYWNEGADEYFNSTGTPIGDADSSAGPAITGPGGQTYQYAATAPFTDGIGSNPGATMGDIAMYFWNRDLQPNIENRVSPPPQTNVRPELRDIAWWQHLVQIPVALGLAGVNTGNQTQFIDDLIAGRAGTAWPNPLTSGVARERIDDLWHAAVNSRGTFFVANNPGQLESQLSGALLEIQGRAASGAGASTNTPFLEVGNAVYASEFNSQSWDGDLLRIELDPATGQRVLIAGVPYRWRASERLNALLQAGDTRNIATMTTSGNRVAFQWGSLDGTQQAELAPVHATARTAQDVLNYVRGNAAGRSIEQPVADGFRRRPATNVIGSIVNSSPLFVKADDQRFELLPTSVAPAGSYATFQRTKEGDGTPDSGRTPLIFAGSNGGMFHAFNGSGGTGGGQEVFAYVPRAVIRDLPLLANPNYSHRYLVDGVAASGDAYFGGAWRTVVVSTGGAGARTVFAIDTNDFYNGSGMSPSSVLWEFDEIAAGSSAGYLGHILNRALIARGMNGQWIAVFGNGYESPNGQAALFVLNLETGGITSVIPAGASGIGNGLGSPVPVFDANRRLQSVYAGDLRGNLWKFDLSNTNAASWGIADTAGRPLFTAVDPSGNPQPITGRPLLFPTPQGGIMVAFGTGQLHAPGDALTQQVQSMYAVWDTTTAGQIAPVATGYRGAGDNVLVRQAILARETATITITGTTTPRTGTFYRLSDKDVTLAPAGVRGWYIDLGLTVNGTTEALVTPRERMLATPTIVRGTLVGLSLVPSDEPCDFGGRSFTYALNPLTGRSSNVFATYGAMEGAGATRLYDLARGSGDSLVFASTINPNSNEQPIVITGTAVPRVRTWRQILDDQP